MKKVALTFFLPVFIIGMMASCGGGGKEHAEESHEEAASAEEVVDEGPVYSGETAVGVVHSVADLAAWVKVYEEVSDPKSRISYYKNVDNPSEIVVFELTTSHEESKASFASEDLKAAMERAGVNSEPVFTYYDMVYMNADPTDAMYRVGISHEVSDFNAWKEKFDADDSRRAEAGLELRGLARDADNANLVHIVFASNDLEPAKAMLSDPELKTVMEEAGVISEPVATFWQLPGM